MVLRVRILLAMGPRFSRQTNTPSDRLDQSNRGTYGDLFIKIIPTKAYWIQIPLRGRFCSKEFHHILEKPSGNKWYFSVLILKRILKNMNDKNQLQGQSLKLKWSFGMLNVGIWTLYYRAVSTISTITIRHRYYKLNTLWWHKSVYVKNWMETLNEKCWV